MKVLKKLLKQQWFLYCLVFGALGGVVLLFGSHAATSSASVEPESGARSGSVMLVSDANASGGNGVKFGSGSTGGPTTLPSPGVWTNVTGSLAGMQSECGDLTGVFPVPNSSSIIAGVAQKGLWISSTGGSTWTHLGNGNGSAVITNRPSTITYDPNNASIFYESGIYNGGGVYKTTDGGTTFTQLGNIGHDDHVDIDFSDPARQTLVAGGHEQSQTVYKSSDAGQTWTNIGANLPSGTGFSSQTMVINSQTYLVGTNPSWGGGTPGIYRTTNSGATWTKVSTLAPDSQALKAVDGTIYWHSGSSLAKSTDAGLTWTSVGSNLNQAPVQLPDARIVSAIGSNLAVSADGGANWTTFGANEPYSPQSMMYSAGNGAFYISHFDCNFTNDVVLPDAIERLK